VRTDHQRPARTAPRCDAHPGKHVHLASRPSSNTSRRSWSTIRPTGVPRAGEHDVLSTRDARYRQFFGRVARQRLLQLDSAAGTFGPWQSCRPRGRDVQGATQTGSGARARPTRVHQEGLARLHSDTTVVCSARPAAGPSPPVGLGDRDGGRRAQAAQELSSVTALNGPHPPGIKKGPRDASPCIPPPRPHYPLTPRATVAREPL